MTIKYSATYSGFDSHRKTIGCLGLICASLCLVASCASQRISNVVERYGIAPRKAECIGDRLGDRLSFAQLQALNRAAKAYQAADFPKSAPAISDLMTVASELRDPQSR